MKLNFSVSLININMNSHVKRGSTVLLPFFMCVGHDITSSPLKYGSRVFVAKCSEPQAGNGDVMSEGSG